MIRAVRTFLTPFSVLVEKGISRIFIFYSFGDQSWATNIPVTVK